jgi:hypothetical protein
MRQTDKSRGLVPQVARGARTDMFRNRMSSLDPFVIPLETAWAGGCHNGAALWRAMKAVGFTGGLRVVTEWATRKRKEEGTATRGNRQCKAPSARRIAHMMTTDRDQQSKTVAHTIAFIGKSVPDLTNARLPFFSIGRQIRMDFIWRHLLISPAVRTAGIRAVKSRSVRRRTGVLW